MEYGVNVSNKFAFLCDDEDAHDPAEILARAEQEREKEKLAPKSVPKKPVVVEKKNVCIAPHSANKENVDVRRNQQRTNQRGGFDRKDRPRGPPRGHDNETHHGEDRFGENRPPHQQREGGFQRRGDGPRGPRGGAVGGWQNRPSGDRPEREPRPRPPRNEGSGGENNAVSDGDNQQVHRSNGPRYPRGGRTNNGPRGDRISGSDKTGVRAVPKKDGFGKGNWGTDKDELAVTGDIVESAGEGEQTKPIEEGEHKNVTNDEEVAVEEEKVRELTLEEWKAQQKSQKPTFNVRKAGEGGDQKIYQKLVLVKPVNKNDGHSTEEDEEANQNKREPREKPLNIEVSFSDSQRNRGGFRDDRRNDYRNDYRSGDRPSNFERGEQRRSGGRGGYSSGGQRGAASGSRGSGRPQQSGGAFNLTAESFPALGAR